LVYLFTITSYVLSIPSSTAIISWNPWAALPVSFPRRLALMRGGYGRCRQPSGEPVIALLDVGGQFEQGLRWRVPVSARIHKNEARSFA
jgi:hypothetical protein